MVKDIIVFGDSFMYGHETNYTNFVNNKDFHKQFKEATGSEFKQITENGDSGKVRMNYNNYKWFRIFFSIYS